jgi:aminopeptidase-like protein
MKITDRRDSNRVHLTELAIKDAFLHNNELFVRIEPIDGEELQDHEIMVLSLLDGKASIMDIANNMFVELVELECIIRNTNR